MSISTLVTELGSILGGLGVGSVLGQYVGSSKDRREARARVLSALADAEESRWAGPDNATTLGEFIESVRKLQTAALIARLPRDAVREYAILARTARWVSEQAWERTPDPDTGGGVDLYLADATREAATAISTLAWSWVVSHFWRWCRAQKRISKHLSRLQSTETKNALERSRRAGFV